MHDEQTNFQNITEISVLPSSFCLLLGAHVLIVMGALQIYIDDDDDDVPEFTKVISVKSSMPDGCRL